ncbi:MAG: acetyl-CoA carboxylase biotin carboxyl carrier protein [Chlamydiia bacterium]|nr:acetyl-CoA carboxylase biotin carboxyl carrier protein [Chlamydiia bacterium]
MELKQIKELMTAMGRLGIKKLSLKQDKVELQLEREGTEANPFDQSPSFASSAEPIKKASYDLPKSQDHQPISAGAPVSADGPGSFITSPMVGTFYMAPAPDAAPFVQIGQKVTKDTVVCIVEAMKVMNEIKAGQSGTISERLVDSESPVEFGTKLFRVTP